jgi:hypothetical protein
MCKLCSKVLLEVLGHDAPTHGRYVKEPWPTGNHNNRLI